MAENGEQNTTFNDDHKIKSSHATMRARFSWWREWRQFALRISFLPCFLAYFTLLAGIQFTLSFTFTFSSLRCVWSFEVRFIEKVTVWLHVCRPLGSDDANTECVRSGEGHRCRWDGSAQFLVAPSRARSEAGSLFHRRQNSTTSFSKWFKFK